jgi:hypothetical protein
MSTASPLQAALSLAEEYGLPVFPCKPNKQPYTLHGFKDASGNIEQLAEWWEQWPGALVGVPTGSASKLLVIDVDPDGADWYSQRADDLKPGRIHKTHRGHHLLYRMPAAEVKSSQGKIAAGVDVRADGGYMVWWPAHGLEAIGGLEDIAEPPAWLLALLREPEQQQPPTAKPNGAAKFVEGQRHAALTAHAGRLRRKGLKGAELIGALIGWNKEHCEPPQDREDVIRIARDYTPKAGNDEPASMERPYVLLPVEDFLTALDPPEFVVEGLFETQSVVGLVAPPEAGKSLLMQNVGACVATDKPFHGRKVKHGLVVYLCGEGQHGLRARFQALESRYGLGLCGAPLRIAKVAASLLDPVEVARVRDAIGAEVDRCGLPLTLL